MERIVFKSIGKEDIRYVWEDDHYKTDNNGFYSNCGGYVSNCAFQFETMGDGDVQHTPQYLVNRDDIEDYICSMAIYIADNATMDTYKVINYGIHLHSVRKEQVQFLLNLKSNGKQVYFNLNDCKKSTRASLEYDKRWERLPEEYQGNFDTIYNMFVPSFYGFLDRLYLAEEIRHHADYNVWIDYDHTFGVSRQSQLFSAMQLIQSFCEAMEKMEYVERAADCLRHNLRLDAVPVDLPEDDV